MVILKNTWLSVWALAIGSIAEWEMQDFRWKGGVGCVRFWKSLKLIFLPPHVIR